MDSTIKLLKYIVHVTFIIFRFVFPRDTTSTMLAHAMNGIGARWHGEMDPIFSYIVMCDFLKNAGISGRGLELGGGYSTIVFSDLVLTNNITLTSVDVDPNKYLRILPRPVFRRRLFKRIQKIDRLTVHMDQITEAYTEGLKNELGRFNAKTLIEGLSKYIRGIGNTPKEKTIYSSLARWLESDDALTDPGGLSNILVNTDEFDEVQRFYTQYGETEGGSFCTEVIREDIYFDFIFFDCGELSSWAEWLMLRDRIRVGGYALFHDIYFPKSIKNFIICGMFESDDAWKIVNKSSASIQGHLIAQRLE